MASSIKGASKVSESLRQQTELVNYKALLADVECVFAVAELEKRDTRMDVRQELKTVELSSEAVDDTPLTQDDEVITTIHICCASTFQTNALITGSCVVAAH